MKANLRAPIPGHSRQRCASLRIPFGARAWAVAAVVAAMFLPTNAIAQYSYPACQGSQNGHCVMTDLNGGPVSHGAVNVYVIWYGPFAGIGNAYLQSLVPYLIYSLNDSSHQATSTTYYDLSGPNATKSYVSGHIVFGGQAFDAQMRQGSTLYDSSIQTEIETMITLGPGLGGLPEDPNGIYLVLPDNTVKTIALGAGFCTNLCGYNNVVPWSGIYIHYAAAADTLGCNGNCSWNIETANNGGGLDTNGAIDGELSTISHEINEILTDPFNSASGWYTSGEGPNDQMADYCAPGGLPADLRDSQWNTAAGSTYQVAGTSATANFHGAFGLDFMLQTLRANAPGGTGYCANEYGGVFWQQNFGYTWTPYPLNNGDWSPGSYKGECQSGQPMTGISKYTSAPQAHAVMCSSVSDPVDYVQSASSCTPVYFDTFLVGNNQLYSDPTDWDPGYYKGECAQNQFVAGVSQSTTGVVNGLLCCTPPAPGAVSHLYCEGQLVNSSTVAPSPSYDWDDGYYKGTCQSFGGVQGYVAGVSAATSNNPPAGAVHGILCCFP